MPTKARVGDIRSQVNDGLKPQEAGPDAKLTLTEGLTEHTALLTPGFQTVGYRTLRELISTILSRSVCGHLLQQPHETNRIMRRKKSK